MFRVAVSISLEASLYMYALLNLYATIIVGDNRDESAKALTYTRVCAKY